MTMKTVPATQAATMDAATLDAQAIRMMQEKQKSRILRAWLACGIFFMALPGTLLGFTNLLTISAHRGAVSLPQAWMEGHGHAQVFGWIGSFVLGIGFYSQPTRGRAALRLQLATLLLWEPAVALRWFANIYSWHWRTLVPLTAMMELAAILLFLSAARQHKRAVAAPGAQRTSLPPWMMAVLMSTAGLAGVVFFNAYECARLALYGANPAFPHAVDQHYLVLLGWGFLAPVVWGFSLRWLTVLLGLPPLRSRLFAAALLLDAAGVIAGLFGSTLAATILLVAAALACVAAMRIFARPIAPARTRGVHPSFAFFARIPYFWLVIASLLGLWAALADRSGGIWGASRHALTVGFAATMVFTIGPRILPNFIGVVGIFSRRLMAVALVFLQLGCTLRVASEPLAYEGIAGFAWKLLPVSGMLELGGVLLFALNLVLTLAVGKSAFLPQAHTPASPDGPSFMSGMMPTPAATNGIAAQRLPPL